MGVGVHDCGSAMGRPAGVAYARFARQRFCNQTVRQVDELANRAAAFEMACIYRGDTGAIIAAVFQAFECFDQDRSDLVIS